ncbi:MAG TPA: M23 family metallopeptidase [Candidatus Limnocylindrales bacterium]
MRKTTLIAGSTVTGLVLSTLYALPAAAARPDFQLPFPCGQQWRGETRADHSPRWAIDFNQGSGSDDLGKPVVASADGHVDFAGTGGGGYGNLVVIKHGDATWSSAHAHLNSMAVDRGDPVRAGEVIGRVGSSGGNFSPHLHYEQRRDGNDVPIVFNGNAVEYDSLKTYTSRNCGGGIEPVDLSVSGVTDADGDADHFRAPRRQPVDQKPQGRRDVGRLGQPRR